MATALVIGLGFTSMPLHCLAAARYLLENGNGFLTASRERPDEIRQVEGGGAGGGSGV